MKHTTPTRKSILAASFFCLATQLTAQTPEKSQQEQASAVKSDTVRVQPGSTSSVATPALNPSMTTASWSVVTQLSNRPSASSNWGRVEPGTLSLALRNDPTVAPPTQRYGAAPAIVNFNFGRR